MATTAVPYESATSGARPDGATALFEGEWGLRRLELVRSSWRPYGVREWGIVVWLSACLAFGAAMLLAWLVGKL